MRWGVVVVAVAVVAVAGCTSGGGGAPQAGVTTTPAGPAADDTGSATPTPTPTPDLPGGCDQVLPFTDLDEALGRPLFGQSRYVVGVAEPAIGRTGRVTCQYGLPASGRGAAPLEVGVSTYRDADAAAARVAVTVAALRRTGVSQKTATVAGRQATLVGTRADYNLVLADGDRTVAVTISRGLRVAALDRAAINVAGRVLANWGR